MSSDFLFHPCLAALRPWPFGPPLRGRAPRGEAGMGAAHRRPGLARLPPASDPGSGGRTTVPAWIRVWVRPIYSA